MDVGQSGTVSAIGDSASLVLAVLRSIYERVKEERSGELASYIPELARVEPERFGICLATANGHVYSVGDFDHAFTIQSVSKPFVYGLALEDRGETEVLQRIGVEPSGDAFNAIVFDEKGNRPFNPMVNAGAIAASALINGKSHAHRLARMMAMFEAYAGRPLEIDDAVFHSERETGHRNRAIAFLELNFGMIEPPVEEHLDLYFRQCSVLVTTRDLALMAATLANDGVHPLTRQRAISSRHVRSILSVMSTCGMYDYSGGWTFRVGLPAKSGVGGGIIAVLPGQFGLGVFSPRLDSYGNSVRGVRVCEEISSRFGLHSFDVPPLAATVLRRRTRGNELFSKRQRTADEMAVLTDAAREILIYDLQGPLTFTTVEEVLHALEEDLCTARFFLLNGKRVASVDESGRCLLMAAHEMLLEHHRTLLLTQFSHDVQKVLLGRDFGECPGPLVFADADLALEWCEDRVLERAGGCGEAGCGGPVSLADMDLTHGFDAEELAALAALLEERHYGEGEFIFREGDPADALYMLSSGSAVVRLRVDNGVREKRLAAIGPGLTFGELSLLQGGERSADVIAVGPVRCHVLSAAGLEKLTAYQPSTAIKLLKNVASSLAARLVLANREIRALED